MPDSTRPDGSALTESDADRLSERFTASWDAPPEPQVEPAPVVVSVPEPVRPVVKPKHTLLGIAPIVVGEPSSGAAPVVVAVPTAATSRSAPPASSAAPPSSPSSAIQAFTTPSKPYVPKDDPSTPAVVIAESVLPPAERARALSAQTIPGQTGSTGRAYPAPFAPTTPEASTTADTYPPARRSSKLPLVLAAVGVTALVVVAAVALSGGSEEAASGRDAVSPSAVEPVAAEAPAPTKEASPSQPVASAPAAAVASPAPQPLVEEDATLKKARGKHGPGALRRPAARPQPRAVPAAPAAAPSPDPVAAAPVAVPVPVPPPAPVPAAPAPAKPSKSVIVRETPF